MNINGFPYEKRSLGAFEVIGFTKIVQSGGELYDAVWSDGRWQALQNMTAGDKRIYGIASFDKECSKDTYRYTMGITRDENFIENEFYAGQLYPFHVKKSSWIVFSVDFEKDYGAFWSSDPYKMIGELGHSFNKVLGLHIDVYAYDYDDHAMEFWMPVK